MGGTQEAVRVARGKIGREMAAADAAQVDLEEVTGVQPAQARREAEAGGIAADRLRSIVERIERLDEERKGIADNIKDIFTEAASSGFDRKVVRQIISIRKKEPAEVEEQETLLDLYKRALGMA
jgi:uncharacterized protein (UPF0335 family)